MTIHDIASRKHLSLPSTRCLVEQSTPLKRTGGDKAMYLRQTKSSKMTRTRFWSTVSRQVIISLTRPKWIWRITMEMSTLALFSSRPSRIWACICSRRLRQGNHTMHLQSRVAQYSLSYRKQLPLSPSQCFRRVKVSPRKLQSLICLAARENPWVLTSLSLSTD